MIKSDVHRCLRQNAVLGALEQGGSAPASSRERKTRSSVEPLEERDLVTCDACHTHDACDTHGASDLREAYAFI